MSRVGFQFSVLGKAVPMQRVRFNGKTRRTYTPDESMQFRERIQAAYRASLVEDDEPFDKSIPLAMTIVVTLPLEIKKSWSKSKRDMVENGEMRAISKNTGDVDNYAKAVQDALNGLAYHDDSQIVSLKVIKKYQELDGVPSTFVMIEESDDDEDF